MSREPRLDGIVRQSLPRSEVLLAQLDELRHGKPGSRGRDLGGFSRASEIARVHGIEAFACEPFCELVRLRTAFHVERNVGVSLDPAIAVPVGLAMARQQDERRHVGYGSRMPILEVTALPQPADVDTGAVAVALTSAVAAELGERQEGTWVVWRTVQAGHYAEGAHAPVSQPLSTHPPLVRVIAYEGRPAAVVARIVTVVAETIVRELELAPGNAFVLWDEARAGRLYTGGSVVGT